MQVARGVSAGSVDVSLCEYQNYIELGLISRSDAMGKSSRFPAFVDRYREFKLLTMLL